MAKRRRNSSSSDEEGETKNQVSSDSSSSSDDEDGDWNQKKKATKKTKPKAKNVKKVKTEEEDAEEREEGEVEDDDDDDIEEFNDGYDENLMGDEDDQKRLAMMTEKEREQELFNRSEKREVLKTRFEIEKKLRMAKKKELNKTQSDVSQRSTERRRNLEDKRKVKDAIKDLKQIREKKKEKQKQTQQRLRAADVYSSDSDSDDDKNAGRKTSSSSSSSSSSSDDSDDEKPKNRNDDVKKEEDDWDERQGSDQEQEPQEPWKLTCEKLNEVRLSRCKMENWCHAPFFKDTVVGCFVRINIGQHQTTKKSIYIAAQIVDVMETPKIYNLGNTRTNKGIKLRHAREPERVFRLEFVSNDPFSDSEFNKWFENMEKDRCDLPGREFFERKKKDIQNALNYQYTDSDIEVIIQEKERFKNRPVNFALKKTKLMKEKELAELNGDNDKVDRINQELEELEAEAKTLDRKRTQNIAAISYINERNRMRNIQEAERALVEQGLIQKTMKDDPFTRRKCTPTMIHMFNKSKSGLKPEAVSSVSEDLTDKMDISSQSELSVTNDKELSLSDLNSTPEPKPVANERPLSPNHHNDLFSAHNFDIKIDFDVDIGLPTASAANSFSSSSFSSNHNSFSAPKPANRRSLNLDEYKKKKGLI